MEEVLEELLNLDNCQVSKISNGKGVIEISFKDLQVESQIGQGGFSVILKGKYRGSPVAIKKVFDPVITDDLLSEMQNEARMLGILRHPQFVTLMGVCSQAPDLAIVVEFCSGNLFDALHKTQTNLSIEKRLRIARDIAQAYTYLHEAGIVHRDLKSLNILVDE